jgi:hypothetical protein
MKTKHIPGLLIIVTLILFGATGVSAVAPPDAPPLISSPPVTQGVKTAQETISLSLLQQGPIYLNPFLIIGIILIIIAIVGIFYIRSKKKPGSGYKPQSKRLQK